MKQIISLITTMVLVWNIVAGAVITAAAEKANEHEYVYSDYSVLYTVVNEWSGYQSVEVKLTNTGEESLFGWGLKYDAGGTIDNIWNAKILSQNETEYIVKGESYARVLAPGKSASFGYVLSCDNPEMPEDIVLCNDWRTTEKVEISYEITDDWTSSYKAVVTIANNGKSNVEAWKLAFSHTGNIKNLWTDDVLSDADGKALVVSSNASAIIKKGESYTFSFIAEKDAEEPAELSDFVFTESYINTEKQPEKIEPLYVFGYSEFKDDELKILWYSSVEEGTFSVVQSKNNIDYKEIFSAEKAYEYTYGKIDFEENYFKITQTLSDGRSAESPVFIVKYDKEKGDCEVELLDSDEDGLPDVFEETYGTDPMKKDTDEDGLTDYEEIYLTGTDPLVYNSVDESLSDAEADSDGDGLSNREELDLGTNPLNPDTDGDGLTDGEEVELGTDPLNPDTDGDRIPDGDEIKLKLDPMSDTTDGIKDSERTTEQEVSADSEVLSQINTDENPMKVSIELEAAGLAETSLSVGESGYASAISNSAVVGAIPEFTYTDGLTMGEVTVKFTADKSVRKNTVGTYAEDCDELKGIKRLNIFKYFEDTNILLPIETFHDEKNNTVYAKTDCLGTYCVMDLEVWMQNLGVEPASSSEKTESVQVAYGAAKAMETAEDERLNVVFFLDARSSISDKKFNDMRDLIYKTVDDTLSDRLSEVNLFLWVYRNKESIAEIPIDDVNAFSRIRSISKSATESGESDELVVTFALNRLDQQFGKGENGEWKKGNSGPTLFLMVADEYEVLAESKKASEVYQLFASQENLFVSFVSNTLTDDCYVKKIVDATKGKILNFDSSELKDYIWKFMPEEYMIITANNYERVRLDDMLKKDSETNTDDDQLSDWNEVNTNLIEKLDPGATDKGYLLMDDMPTINDIKGYYGQAYVQSGFERFRNNLLQNGSNSIMIAYGQPVVPIRSNPADADSDNDGVIDCYDANPLDSDDRSLNKNGETEGKDSVFTVLKVFEKPEKEIVKKGAASYAYSIPNDSYKESAILFDMDEATSVIAVVFSDSKHWLKLKYSGRYLYVYYEDIRDYADLSVVINLQNRDVIKVNEEYIYEQDSPDGSQVNKYNYLSTKTACACFSYATALSIILDLKITPDLIDADDNGYINKFICNLCKKKDETGNEYLDKITDEENQNEQAVISAYVAKYYDSSNSNYGNMCNDQAKVFFEIDQHLTQSTKPILFHIYYPNRKASYGNEQHWALILGKKEGKYQIYDPYYGKIGDLETTMMYYKKYGNDKNTCRYEYGIIEVTRYD